MNDRPFTLIDVMLGIRKHGIITKLSKESFTFLIGLILEHNEVGFKDDFNLTNAQAQSIGGGNNRQSVKRRRDAIAKFEIDGENLLEFETGNFGQNTCCKYKIRYDLLCRYNQAWTDENGLPSYICDGSRDGVRNSNGTVPVTEPVTILRSEEKREEKTTTTEEVVAVDFQSKDSEEELGYTLQPLTNDIIQIKGMVFGKYKAYINTAPSDGECMRALEGFSIEQLIEAGGRAPDYPKTFGDKKNRTPGTALGIVVSYAKNPSWGGERYENGPVKTEETQGKTKIEKLEYWLKYCSDLPNRYDEIYPCMEKLADLTGESVDEIFARCEFLPGTLDKYVKET